MIHTRFESLRFILPALQLASGALTGFASAFEWDLWWACAIPWAILNLPGIILAIPLVAAVFLAAGVAQLDWKNSQFFGLWFIVAPTVLSVIACFAWQHWRHRKRKAALRPAFRSGR